MIKLWGASLTMRNYKEFFAICKQIGISKGDAVLQFTEGRTDSLRKLDDGEWKELMIRLRRMRPTTPNTWQPAPGDAQRKKLIAIAGSMLWGKDTIEIVGKLNVWLEERWGKELNDYTPEELNKIVWVMENKVYKDFLNRV